MTSGHGYVIYTRARGKNEKHAARRRCTHTRAQHRRFAGGGRGVETRIYVYVYIQ